MNNIATYQDYIASKAKNVLLSGLTIEPDELSSAMFDFQRHCVTKALNKGRFCLFEDCGLGKTLQQLSWSQIVQARTGRSVLILALFADLGRATTIELPRTAAECDALVARIIEN